MPSRSRKARAGRPVDVIARQDEIRGRLGDLEADPGATEESHGAERDELIREYVVLRAEGVGAITGQVTGRDAEIASIQRAYADPANRESGADTGQRDWSGGGTLVKDARHDRPPSAGELIQRMGSNPWRHEDGPLNRTESADGLIARCHIALEGLEPVLTREGCGKLADAFAESSSWNGITVKRSRDEQAQAADLFLALSDPHYGSAFRQALQYPAEFYGMGGVGFETLSDEERHAWRRVRTNDLCRAAFSEASGAAGTFAISLDLHPDIILSNAGSANPFRKLARNVVSTTNVAEFVVSAGSTANWLPEGSAVADTTPALAQLAVTHYKESVWIFGSLEIWQDAPSLGQAVPALIADAKDRLEVVAFALGTGSAQPFGLLVHGTSDATATALTAALVYALHQNLPPRFRVADGARPVWLCNVAIMNALRTLPKFAGAVSAMIDDGQADGIPEMLSIDVMECSAMAAAQTSGLKTLAIADMSQFIITNRQPELLLHEPLFKDQATGRPSGQSGWFSWSRTGSDLAVATACQYHTN